METSAKVEGVLEAGLAYLAEQYGVQVSQTHRADLLRYISLLIKWNRIYNLTAVREPSAMVQRHLLDSLVLCRWLPELSCATDQKVDVVDIGSGAGLPVLPLAIVRPDLRFVSVESNGKKTRFQQQVVVELNISNVQIRNQRVQDVESRAEFVTSRAFTAPGDFLQIAESLCTEQALVAIMLGHCDRLPDPLPAMFSLQELVPVDIPGNSAPRHIALCRYNP